ncbi:MAG: hypothetical protein ACPGU1_08825 [Myxococcota bacterium]
MDMRSSHSLHMHRPERALLHPLWLIALTLLVVNDHVLKGAGLVPAALTGKLSDVVGMLVAPVLLAAILRLSSRRALMLAHLATGVIFAAINLSPSAARGFEAMTAWTPFPWAIVVDPTDLLALPALAVSWAIFTPVMRQHLSVPRWIAVPAICVGALACMATSPPIDEPPTIPAASIFADVWGHVVIENAQDEVANIRIRTMHGTTFMDCAFVAQDPTSTLSRALFGEPEFWEIEPDRAVAVMGPGRVGVPLCKAYLIDGAGLNTQLLFIDVEAYPATWLPSTSMNIDPSVTLTLQPGASELSDHPALFDAPPIVTPEPETSCDVVSDEASLAWSEVPDMDIYGLEGIEESPDGCMKLSLSPHLKLYLCIPRDTFPFEVGELLMIRPLTHGEDFGTIEGIEFLGATRTLRVARGQDFVPFDATTTLNVEPSEGCGYVHDVCGNLTRPLTIRYGGPSGVLAKAGEALSLDTTSYVYVVRAFDLPVGDTDCLDDATQSDRLIESVYVSY